MKEKIARWYRQGLWNERMVRAAALRSIITEADADGIIGGEAAA